MNAVDTRRALPTEAARPTIRRLAGLWAVGTGMAVVLVTLAYFLAEEVTGALVVTGAGEVTLDNVIGFTIFGGTIGAVLAYLSRRFARRPRLTFLTVALISLAAYAVVPLTAAESLETAIWLNVFHIVVAIPVIGALDRYMSPNRGVVPA